MRQLPRRSHMMERLHRALSQVRKMRWSSCDHPTSVTPLTLSDNETVRQTDTHHMHTSLAYRQPHPESTLHSCEFYRVLKKEVVGRVEVEVGEMVGWLLGCLDTKRL